MLNMRVQININMLGLRGIRFGPACKYSISSRKEQTWNTEEGTELAGTWHLICLLSTFSLPVSSPSSRSRHLLHHYDTWSRSLDSLWESSSWWQRTAGKSVRGSSSQRWNRSALANASRAVFWDKYFLSDWVSFTTQNIFLLLHVLLAAMNLQNIETLFRFRCLK